ncbi:MAG TPA: hypothetical protein VI160_04880 [Gemmatimonadales bacterium]
MTRLRKVLLAAALVAAAECGHNATGPTPGTLFIKMVNRPANPADGAILLTLSGPAAPGNLTAAAGDTVWGGPFTGTVNKMVITGNITTGTLASFDVADVALVGQYVVTITQIAASGDYSLQATSGYTLNVTQ